MPALPFASQDAPRASTLAPFALNPMASLRANVQGLLAFRLQAPLGPAEVTTVAESLEEALSVLQAGGAEARSQLLDTSLIVALASPSAAQLWACVTEAILEGEAGVGNAASLMNQVVTTASAVASAIFTSAALEL